MSRATVYGTLAVIVSNYLAPSASQAAAPEELAMIRDVLSNPPHRPMPLEGGFGIGRVYEKGGIRVELTDEYTLISIPAKPRSGETQRHYIDFRNDGVPEGFTTTSGPVSPQELSMILDELRQVDVGGLESALNFGPQRARRDNNSPPSTRNVTFIAYVPSDTTVTNYNVGEGQKITVSTKGSESERSAVRSIVRSVQEGYDNAIAALKEFLNIR